MIRSLLLSTSLKSPIGNWANKSVGAQLFTAFGVLQVISNSANDDIHLAALPAMGMPGSSVAAFELQTPVQDNASISLLQALHRATDVIYWPLLNFYLLN